MSVELVKDNSKPSSLIGTMKVYPIAEKFVEIQGEGVWSGAIMAFIRLAGCTVGKPYPKEMYKGDPAKELYPKPGLPIYTEQCTLYDGRTMACDTDYRMKEKLTVEQLADWVPTKIGHVCITGGEPMMHDLQPLVFEMKKLKKLVHIETSGTIPLAKANLPATDAFRWLTVSPKQGCLPDMIRVANEIKLLVDKDFNPDKLPLLVFGHPTVFLNPVNYEHEVNVDNLRRCRELLDRFPQWRLGGQLHKVLEHFLKERVR